jgi:hypothetical protein
MAMRDRAVTTTLNYVLLLGIVSILVSTLVFGVGGLVTDQQERAVRAQLDVVGNRLANDVVAVDGAVQQTDGEIHLRSDLPERAVGSRYRVTVSNVAGDRYQLTLRSTDPDVVATVTFRSRTSVAETTVRGGTVVIEYTGSEVVLRD